MRSAQVKAASHSALVANPRSDRRHGFREEKLLSARALYLLAARPTRPRDRRRSTETETGRDESERAVIPPPFSVYVLLLRLCYTILFHPVLNLIYRKFKSHFCAAPLSIDIDVEYRPDNSEAAFGRGPENDPTDLARDSLGCVGCGLHVVAGVISQRSTLTSCSWQPNGSSIVSLRT